MKKIKEENKLWLYIGVGGGGKITPEKAVQTLKMQTISENYKMVGGIVGVTKSLTFSNLQKVIGLVSVSVSDGTGISVGGNCSISGNTVTFYNMASEWATGSSGKNITATITAIGY